MATCGYAGRILRADLSSRRASTVPTEEYAGRFLGGRGIAARIYWDEVPPGAGPFDAANRLVFITGPLCGVPAVSGSRWEVCGKGPQSPPRFSHANLGGRWGAALKFAGYDGVIVQGISDKPVYLFVHDDKAEFRDASGIWGMHALQAAEALKGELGSQARVTAIGPAAENRVVTATFLADNYTIGSGGLGAVMGAKNLKAVVVLEGRQPVRIARPDELREVTEHYRGLNRAFPTDGWEHLSRWSRDPTLEPRLMPGPEMKKETCYGCLGRCARKTYVSSDGRKGKFICHAAFFYQPWADRYYGDWNDAAFEATWLCDTYGLDAVALDLMIDWLHLCHQAGILSDESTGLPISKLGSAQFIRTLVRRIAFREGFGDLLAQGIHRAAEAIGPAAVEQVGLAGHLAEPGYYPYGPRLYNTNALLYAMEPRMPIQQLHEVGLLMAKWSAGTRGLTSITSEVVRTVARKFWGGEAAGDFTTWEGKARAVKMIQERQYVEASLILCNFLWPITDCEASPDKAGDPGLESRILAAVLGNGASEHDLYRVAERIFNQQRAILVREGHRGRSFDTLAGHFFNQPLKYDQANAECLVPGKDGQAVSRRGAVVDRDGFEKTKDQYYALRGWDVATGLQTRDSLEKVGLPDVALDLERRGLLG